MTKPIAKRLIIKQAIENGGATKESLIQEAECSVASLQTNFTYLRLMGFCPIKDEEGVYSFVTADEWEKIKEEKSANSGKSVSKTSPKERYFKAIARKDRCEKTLTGAEERNEKASDEDEELLDLRLQKADIELKIADIELARADEAYDRDADEGDDEEVNTTDELV